MTTLLLYTAGAACAQEQAQRVNIRIAAALKFSGGLSKVCL